MGSLKTENWDLKLLFGYQSAAAVLYGTWLWEPLRPLWDSVDFMVFRYFNNSLYLDRIWALIWAVVNHRLFDLAAAGLLLLLLVDFVRQAPAAPEKREWPACWPLASAPLLQCPFWPRLSVSSTVRAPPMCWTIVFCCPGSSAATTSRTAQAIVFPETTPRFCCLIPCI